VGVDGTMHYLVTDLGVNLETAEGLVPLEIIQTASVGEMNKAGFVEGWKAVG
jgi:DCN1-like protein 1/2